MEGLPVVVKKDLDRLPYQFRTGFFYPSRKKIEEFQLDGVDSYRQNLELFALFHISLSWF